ncbi:lipoyl(octanoyl) transferase LipB [Methylobacillus sp. MM3]|jgi:lipoyl(octanoyl) transferase|uniref:lipoyl(octanoyl) transferase LipB n=1 Tax=Methylobacillus sp. MM3 TaxID=1848039 RepID=UPI0009EE6A18|nr:lipoyl(octanoyl) transferase LipB [Methylobacillus sp. MM3]
MPQAVSAGVLACIPLVNRSDAGEDACATKPALVRRLGNTDYETTWQAMQAYTAQRTPDSPDELWLTEHPPVYTLGLNRKDVRMPWRADIPLVRTDRGGKITYHGPGQIVIYLLLDIKRQGLTVRQLVDRMEGAIITLLAEHGVSAEGRPDAPGVYVNGSKIASLGLRLKNGCCYHGLSLNVDMDLSPFKAIDPCGYRGLQVTQTRNLGIAVDCDTLAQRLIALLQNQLS